MRKNYALLLLAFFALIPQLWAQSVTGVVVDENDDPLPGVAVVAKPSGQGTATEIDGRYTLNLPDGDYVLEFSFIGYKTESKAITVSGGSAVADFKMSVESSELDEVVVVGYGVQRKRELTNSVVSLKGSELQDMPTPSFENAIQGKASGVQVITGSGLAGSGSVIRVRGIASVSAGGDPLYIVDGIPITQDYFGAGNRGAMNMNPLSTINPNDIESVEILKDAAATGIYGSRGSNGVILITTKRGKKKGLSYSFNTTVGFAVPTARPNMLNSSQYLQMFEEAWVNDGEVGTPVLPGGIAWEDAQNINTDWVDQTIGTGVKQQYDFGVGKGGEKGNFYAGISYSDNGSYLKGNSFQRLSGRFNGDLQLTNKLKGSLSTSVSRGVNNRVNAAWSGGLGAAMSTALPIYPIYYDKDVYNDAGELIHRAGDYWLEAGIGNNPTAMRELQEWKSTETRTINSVSLEYAAMKNLIFRGSASLDYQDFVDDQYQKPGFRTDQPESGFAYRNQFYSRNWNGNLTANYLYDLNENHRFNFLLGTEFQDYHKTWTDQIDVNGASGSLGDNPDQPWSNNPKNRKTEWAFASVFLRANYSIKNKYFFEGLVRTDASSRFGANNRFGFFPAASAGWIMTEEDWLKGGETLTFLKLKASFGINGNANIDDYAQWGYYERRSNGYDNQDFIYPVRLSNPDLKWETSTTYDIALEYGLFNDRITGEMAYYYKDTRDMLMNVTVQNSTGFGEYYYNLGSAYNTGFEFALSSKNLVGELRWTTDFNISYNYNELTSIGPFSPDAIGGGTNDTRAVVGMPIGTNYLVKYSHVDPTSGRPVYIDINGNQTFDWSPDDRVPVGSVLPDAIGGIKNTFEYKNWDFSFFFVYTIGGDIYDSSSKRQLGVVTDWNMRTDIFDRWRQPGDQAAYARLTRDTETYGSGTPWINTDQWLHDGSYLRLRNVTLGYSLPRSVLDKWKIDGLRVSFIATNLLTFTNYIGLDPEIARDFENVTDRNMSPNITYLTPPQEQTYSLNINLTF